MTPSVAWRRPGAGRPSPEPEAEALSTAEWSLLAGRRTVTKRTRSPSSHLDLVAAGNTFDVFIAVALQANGDVVIGILGEGVFHDHAAVRAERLIFELLLLGQIGRQRLEVAAWAT